MIDSLTRSISPPMPKREEKPPSRGCTGWSSLEEEGAVVLKCALQRSFVISLLGVSGRARLSAVEKYSFVVVQ